MKKVKIFVVAFLLCAMLPSSALPGIKDFIATGSGEYVYYRDYSFSEESYVGFLQYDDYTLQMRYVRPATFFAEEKSIELLVSLNEEKDAVELSGEKIVQGSNNAEDIELMNYLHELLYEFSARRKSLNNSDFSRGTVRSVEDFAQFGGEVALQFDAYIPIFNLRTIRCSGKNAGTTASSFTHDGKTLFELVKMGTLTSSDDMAFSNFAGIYPDAEPELPQIDILAIDAKAKRKTVECAPISLKLDAQWTQQGENPLWLLGAGALLVAEVIDITGLDAKKHNVYLTRSLLMTDAEVSPRMSALAIAQKKSSTRIETVSYLKDGNTQTHQTYYILPASNNQYVLVTLTAFDALYSANKKYFERIIDSIKILGKK